LGCSAFRTFSILDVLNLAIVFAPLAFMLRSLRDCFNNQQYRHPGVDNVDIC
jgi:hypothetical protein